MGLKIKIKNDTSEMISETARRLGVPVKSIQNEFHMYWHDVNTMFTQYLGYGLYVENFGHFIISVKSIDKIVKQLEIKINKCYKLYWAMKKMEITKNFVHVTKTDEILSIITDYITRIILLDCSINAYNIEVRKKYPKKYEPCSVYLKQYIGRLEKHLNISLTKFPVQINNPIQEVFVQSLQSKGLLPNPVVYKNKKV